MKHEDIDHTGITGVGGGGISSGASNPGSPSAGDVFFRTDLGFLIYYNGTRWLTVQEYTTVFDAKEVPTPLTATGQMYGNGDYGGTWDLWMTTWHGTTNVLTTNDGTKFWTVTLQNGAGTTIDSFTTASDTASTKTRHTRTIGALLGTAQLWTQITATKTSTAGNLYMATALRYRLVIT